MVFVVHMNKRCSLGYPKCAQWRFWSDCANAQADLNLCLVHNLTSPKYVFWLWGSNIFIELWTWALIKRFGTVVVFIQICLRNSGENKEQRGNVLNKRFPFHHYRPFFSLHCKCPDARQFVEYAKLSSPITLEYTYSNNSLNAINIGNCMRFWKSLKKEIQVHRNCVTKLLPS